MSVRKIFVIFTFLMFPLSGITQEIRQINGLRFEFHPDESGNRVMMFDTKVYLCTGTREPILFRDKIN